MAYDGPCKPWVEGSDLEKLPAVVTANAKAIAAQTIQDGDLTTLAAEAASGASAVLYHLSGKQFTGSGCGPVTIRPVARPAGMDSSWPGVGLVGLAGSTRLSAPPGAVSRYGSQEPPTVVLGAFPVTEITAVKIDGVTIPSTEYELRNRRVLVRLRPDPPGQPTARWGWPSSQVEDLPDDQPGTFSISYTYGMDPPAMGKLAARTLGERLLRAILGDTSGYPARVTSLQRQGVNANVTDVMDVVKAGGTGIYPVDLFVKTYNPKGIVRRASVYSPDVGRPRRTAGT